MNYADFVFFCSFILILSLLFTIKLSNLKNLILKLPTKLIRLIYNSFINYSYYVAFEEALGLLDQLRKQQKQKLEKEQNSGSSFSKGFLKITASETFRGIFRTQSNIYNGIVFVKVLQFPKNTLERVYYLIALLKMNSASFLIQGFCYNCNLCF